MFSLVVIVLSFAGLLSVQPVHNPSFSGVQPVEQRLVVVQASPNSTQLLQPTYNPQQ